MKFVVNFSCTLPSSISGTRSRAMRRWKAHDEKKHPYRFCFFIFFDWGFCFAKKSFWRVVWLDGKKQFALQFLVPSSTKIRENTRALLDDGYNFNFYPKKEKLRFLSLSVCSVEGAPIEQFVLASASHWCVGCWGFSHTIFLDWSYFYYPCRRVVPTRDGYQGMVVRARRNPTCTLVHS